MAALSPTLTGAAALVVPPLVVVTRLLRRRVRDAERATRIAVGAVNGQLAEDLAGVEVIRAFGQQAAFSHRFRRAVRAWLRAGNRSVLFNAFYAPTLNVLAAFATALLLWLGARHAFGMVGLSVGTLTAFVLLFARFFTPLVNLGDEWQTVQRALAGAERVFAVLDLPTDVTTSPSTSGQPPAPGGANPRAAGVIGSAAVELRNVGFGYRPGTPVLHGVSLTVQPGEHVAIVEPTGAGKSSLLSLIAGLHVPSAGQVRLAGHDPRVLGDRDRRALLGYVPQTVTLFGGTVTDNVTLGDRELTDDQVQQAARTAGAGDASRRTAAGRGDGGHRRRERRDLPRGATRPGSAHRDRGADRRAPAGDGARSRPRRGLVGRAGERVRPTAGAACCRRVVRRRGGIGRGRLRLAARRVTAPLPAGRGRPAQLHPPRSTDPAQMVTTLTTKASSAAAARARRHAEVDGADRQQRGRGQGEQPDHRGGEQDVRRVEGRRLDRRGGSQSNQRYVPSLRGVACRAPMGRPRMAGATTCWSLTGGRASAARAPHQRGTGRCAR